MSLKTRHFDEDGMFRLVAQGLRYLEAWKLGDRAGVADTPGQIGVRTKRACTGHTSTPVSRNPGRRGAGALGRWASLYVLFIFLKNKVV